jgi:hypothetical protein
MSVENKYRERLMEGILSTGLMALAALFTKSKTRKGLKDIAWKLKNDPAAKAAWEDLKIARANMEQKLDSYCDRFPNSPYCSRRK